MAEPLPIKMQWLEIPALPGSDQPFCVARGHVASFRPGGGAPTLAVIPQIPGHLLWVCGDQDPLIPAEEQQAVGAALSADLAARQDQPGAPLERRFVVAPGAGHGFLCEARSDYNAEAARLGWREMLELFAKAL